MQGFKNLMKANQYTEQALQNFNKRTEQIRKVTNAPLDQFEGLVSVSQSIAILLEKWLIDHQSCQIEDFKRSLFWFSLVQISKKLSANQKELATQLRTQFIEICRQIKNNSILELQQSLELVCKVRNYKSKQQVLQQTQKRYSKLHKSMLSSIENYKKTFTDVKMIYNKQQKIKRYCICETTYEELIQEHNQILQTSALISQCKKEIVQSFNRVIRLSGKGIKNIGSKVLALSKRYLQLSYQKESLYVNMLTTQIQGLQKISLEFQFRYPITDSESQQYLKAGNYKQNHTFVPRIIMSYQLIKETHFLHLGILLVNFEKELGELIRKRKLFNRQILQQIGYFTKAYEKITNMNKDFVSGFQKTKKKFVQLYGVQIYFLPAFSNVLATLELIQQKNVKLFASKYKNIESLLNQQSKILQTLQKDFKTYFMQKFVSKKQIKKKSSLQKMAAQVQNEMRNNQLQSLKIQAFQKMAYLKQMFENCFQKIKRNLSDVKQQMDSILLTLQKSTIQVYTCIKAETELDKQRNQRNKGKEDQIDEIALVKARIFEQSIFSGLLSEENTRITFDGDLNKVEEFKKLKKPQQILEEQNKNKEKQENADLKRKDNLSQQENREGETQNKSQSEKLVKESTNEPQINQNMSKYEKFLKSKINMLPNQKYIQSYACALAYNIILSGRIYITNQRLCFSSKFNPKNIFFGQTFIEIPKKDIKKIEKRQNALVFDNSISITTVHGEMFFTSFFSRNQAYDKILQALQINFDDIMYEPEQICEIPIEQEVLAEQQDDIKQQKLPQREKSIDALLKKYQYRQVSSTTLKFKDLTALKYFKMFELDQQISYNRGKYLGFQIYFKNTLGYSEIISEEWQPNILDYFNSSNIKADTPLAFTKKVKQTVPVVNSGIPFMPKTSKIEERMTAYFYSKDRIVCQTEVRSSGVPYCEYFFLTYKKEITTTELNTISWKLFYSITFVNNTMMRGVIQGRSFEQSKVSMKKFEQEMKRYLKFLEKVSSKTIVNQNKQSGNEASSNQNNANTEDLSVQIDELKSQKEGLAASLAIEKKIHTKTKKILLASILLNIALLLILMI